MTAHALERLPLRLLLQRVPLELRLSHRLLNQLQKLLIAGDLFDLPTALQDIIGQLICRRDPHMCGIRAEQLL